MEGPPKNTDPTPSVKKVVFFGDQQTGKTMLVLRAADDTFSETYLPTIGVDFRIRTTDDGRLKFQMWDTAGQERFRTMTSSYYKSADLGVLVFDVSNKESFASLNKWHEDFLQNAKSEVVFLLIGNKNDLPRQVSYEEAEAWALQHNMLFLDFSAKDGDQKTIFSKLTEAVDKTCL